VDQGFARTAYSGVADQSLATATSARAIELALLRNSGLFDAAWYIQNNQGLPTELADALVHFVDAGWRDGRRPSPYFDTAWYLRQNPDVAHADRNPLLHYLQYGEAEHRAPSPCFDPVWYATQHQPSPGTTLLSHFLRHRCDGTASPLPEFDVRFYLESYPDVAAAGVDPFEHYLLYGYREGRNPSPGFNSRFYISRYLGGRNDVNPLLHWRACRDLLRLDPCPPADEASVHEDVRRFTCAGPDFEEFVPLPPSAPRRVKLLAYYLPQYHAVAENDAWWGKGFTEWTMLARGLPRFAGHQQPRIPRDLGHYTLADTATLRRQIEMARDAGLFGFVWYFYWFNGKRLLDRPLEAYLADASLDFPFCLMWANENWTRRWDGSDDEVLIAQEWREADEPALIACFARHFRDPRYIRLGGRPLLMVYRADLIPDAATTVARWRRRFRDDHAEDPVLVMAQSFEATDPRPAGFDGAVEFPPHKLVSGLAPRNPELTWYDHAAGLHVFAYADVAAASLAEPAPPFPLIKTVVPGWDNDARRQGNGLVLHGATPAGYQDWLAALVERAYAEPFLDERLVCINAWNEWAEGAYLEPDVYTGAAYLNATARAVARLVPAAGLLLLVGHDAFPAGAQLLLLSLGQTLRRCFGVWVEFVLLDGGALLADYQAVAPTEVVGVTGLAAHLGGRGIAAAIVNTTAAAAAVPTLTEAGIPATLLVHELPRLLRERALLGAARAAAASAWRVVFPAASVRDRFVELVPLEASCTRVLPQGCYRQISFSAEARARLRRRLHVPKGTALVLGAGYADLRKGFDLFLQTWRTLRRRHAEVAFCWIGDIDPTLQSYLGPEVAAAAATGRFHMPGFQQDVAEWFSAADLFVLSSREDPYPSAVLEALATGLRVVAFEDSGGIPDLLAAQHCGEAVPMADVEAMADAALAQLALADEREHLAETARARFGFPDYAATLLREAWPDLPDISVVVPNYQYARYLGGRLGSVFGQTHPVTEVIVLDDASTDDSLQRAAEIAEEWHRDIRLVPAVRHAGSVFRQWRRGAELARGEYIWIAEADDEAEPGLLEALAARLRADPTVELAVCDSRSIDAEGVPVWPSYQAYYAECGAAELARDGLFEAPDFARRFLAERNLLLNVSAMLIRRASLLAALARCGRELASYRLAGDWRLYLELLAESPGRVAWVAAALNVHRRHAASVTGTITDRRHLAEIARIHAFVRARLDPDQAQRRRQDEYLRRAGRRLGAVTATTKA